MKRLSKTVLAWSAYDFGNSAYALIVMTIFYPLFFFDFVVPGDSGASLWGISVGISILLTALIAPFLGAHADQQTYRKGLFVLVSGAAIVGTILLPFSATLPSVLGIVLFILTNAAFGLALVLYDSFILVISPEGGSTTVSGIGWAVGYVGGPLALLVAYLVIGGKLPSTLEDYQLVFLITGLFFLVSALWPYRELPGDEPRDAGHVLHPGAFRQVFATLRNWRDLRHIFVFLFAMYFIMDGLTTVVYFISLYAREVLAFSLEQIVLLLLITQLVGIVATVLVSWVAEKTGEILTLIFCSFVWTMIVVGLYTFSGIEAYYYIAAFTGLVVGSTPAIARGYLSKITPQDMRAEIFGFNVFASRIATIFGPVVFGIAASIWGMRLALWTVIPFFGVGVLILGGLWLSEPTRRKLRGAVAHDQS